MIRAGAGRPGRLAVLFLLAAGGVVVPMSARGGNDRPGITRGGGGLDEEGTLLDAYFRLLLAEADLDAFRERVEAHYGEPILCRLLADCPDAVTRRAAVVALGAVGEFRRSNPFLGRALRDPDPVVRRLAVDALWSLWFRADTPENNAALAEVTEAIGRRDLDRAEAMASRLIIAAPRFAEAYNRRAIVAFEQGRFADSAADCRRTLELNPYHIGALGGLAQCQLQLDRPADAVETLRRSSRLQPYNDDIKVMIRRIEARMALDLPR